MLHGPRPRRHRLATSNRSPQRRGVLSLPSERRQFDQQHAKLETEGSQAIASALAVGLDEALCAKLAEQVRVTGEVMASDEVRVQQVQATLRRRCRLRFARALWRTCKDLWKSLSSQSVIGD